MVGKFIEIETKQHISIFDIDGNPTNPLEFKKWLSFKAVEVGTGDHHEYYHDEEQDKDIYVSFRVFLVTLQRTI